MAFKGTNSVRSKVSMDLGFLEQEFSFSFIRFDVNFKCDKHWAEIY